MKNLHLRLDTDIGLNEVNNWALTAIMNIVMKLSPMERQYAAVKLSTSILQKS